MEQTILKQRFPQVELSYETDAHKKVLNSKYDICVSIPTGKKYFAWFTYEPGKATNACYIIDKQGIHFTQVQSSSNCEMSIGTLIYGTLCELPRKFFVIEDIHSYSGISMKHMTFATKMSYIVKILEQNNTQSSHDITFVLPYMARINVDASSSIIDDPIFYDSMLDKTAYVTHHVQFRASNHIVPHLNHNYKKNTAKTQVVQSPIIIAEMPRQDLDYSAAARKKEAVFLVSADINSDVYHLHCYDNKSESQYTYVDLAHVGTYKESKYLNGLFRNIRENDNIDLGEESEDEDMFQNMNPDKYVDLSKRIKMNCVFNNKWRRWVPVAAVSDKARIINVHELIKGSAPRNENAQHVRNDHAQHSRNEHSRNEYAQHSRNEHVRKVHPQNSFVRHKQRH